MDLEIAVFPVAWPLEYVLHWSLWRRTHQAMARFFHYKKRASLFIRLSTTVILSTQTPRPD